MANSIEDIKALANTKLGFARPNKFLVTLPNIGAGGGIFTGIQPCLSRTSCGILGFVHLP